MDTTPSHRSSSRIPRAHPMARAEASKPGPATAPGSTANPKALPETSGAPRAPHAGRSLNPNAAPFTPASLTPAWPRPLSPKSQRTQQMQLMNQYEQATIQPQSTYNGFKLMSPHVKEAIRQAQNLLPPNPSRLQPDSREHSLVFHENPATGKLEVGSSIIGSQSNVAIPADELSAPTTKVHIHTHPYLGSYVSNLPSMVDQIAARQFPDVEFLVQLPLPAPDTTNRYVLYKGTYPPRYYDVVANPHDLPVRPHSPDLDTMPPFKPHPNR